MAENTPAVRRSELIEFLDHIKGMDAPNMKLALDQFERLILLRAESEYADAMNAVQRDMRQILKTRDNTIRQGVTVKYADIGAIDEELRPIYTEHGFSITFTEHVDPRPEFMHWAATVRRGAWKQEHHLYPRRDEVIKGMQRTQMQETGSHATYMRRYLMALAFNVVSAEDVAADIDGNHVDPPPASGDEPAVVNGAPLPVRQRSEVDVKWHVAQFKGKTPDGDEFAAGTMTLWYPQRRERYIGDRADELAEHEGLPPRPRQ
jgi:hypothetical protein